MAFDLPPQPLSGAVREKRGWKKGEIGESNIKRKIFRCGEMRIIRDGLRLAHTTPIFQRIRLNTQIYYYTTLMLRFKYQNF